MKIENKKAKGNFLTFTVKDATNWEMSTLRRLIMNEVPIMAIELVEISKNDSILYDEMIAHRLGLIPLTTDVDSYRLATAEELEKQEYLAQSSVKFTLKAKGPCIVYAKDLVSKDPKIKPVFPETPIVKLLEGQEIALEATAVMGTGRMHAKWSAAHVHFKTLDETSFELHIESWGQLKPEQVVTAAMEEYTRQLKEFESLVGAI